MVEMASDHVSQDIDWEGTEDVMHKLLLAECRFITKHALGNCGVGTTLVQLKFQQDASCPWCGAIEDTCHVYRCVGSDASTSWNDNIQNLEGYLDNTDTDPELSHALIFSLMCWQESKPIDLHTTHASLHPAVRLQHNIRWKNLLEGLAGSHWWQAQYCYYQQHRKQKSSHCWLQGTLLCLARLGRGQRLHRNDDIHTKSRPCHKRANALMQHALIWLYMR